METVELLLLAEEEVVLEDGDPDVIDHEKLFSFFYKKYFTWSGGGPLLVPMAPRRAPLMKGISSC